MRPLEDFQFDEFLPPDEEEAVEKLRLWERLGLTKLALSGAAAEVGTWTTFTATVSTAVRVYSKAKYG